jgi:hypothetical protein
MHWIIIWSPLGLDVDLRPYSDPVKHRSKFSSSFARFSCPFPLVHQLITAFLNPANNFLIIVFTASAVKSFASADYGSSIAW